MTEPMKPIKTPTTIIETAYDEAKKLVLASVKIRYCCLCFRPVVSPRQSRSTRILCLRCDRQHQELMAQAHDDFNRDWRG